MAKNLAKILEKISTKIVEDHYKVDTLQRETETVFVEVDRGLMDNFIQ